MLVVLPHVLDVQVVGESFRNGLLASRLGEAVVDNRRIARTAGVDESLRVAGAQVLLEELPEGFQDCCLPCSGRPAEYEAVACRGSAVLVEEVTPKHLLFDSADRSVDDRDIAAVVDSTQIDSGLAFGWGET
ncbi:unannotated protein [freshwater metagenome]|uniref:Unannotated protein n=1 Tax=freshwater metagenome TaxID=449393 RepID=A0A6J6XK81_9ZZZZ